MARFCAHYRAHVYNLRLTAWSAALSHFWANVRVAAARTSSCHVDSPGAAPSVHSQSTRTAIAEEIPIGRPSLPLFRRLRNPNPVTTDVTILV